MPWGISPICLKIEMNMSEKELNAYRLTSMEETTDEMLSTIMKEAAAEASSSTAKALADYFKEIGTMLQKKVAVL